MTSIISPSIVQTNIQTRTNESNNKKQTVSIFTGQTLNSSELSQRSMAANTEHANDNHNHIHLEVQSYADQMFLPTNYKQGAARTT